MSTRLQIRRDSNSNLAASTPAQGELAYDVTLGRLHVGDGSTAGGRAIPQVIDVQMVVYIGTVSGLSAYTGAVEGSRAIVHDSSGSITYMGTPTGGGANHASCILLNSVWYYG